MTATIPDQQTSWITTGLFALLAHIQNSPEPPKHIVDGFVRLLELSMQPTSEDMKRLEAKFLEVEEILGKVNLIERALAGERMATSQRRERPRTIEALREPMLGGYRGTD